MAENSNPDSQPTEPLTVPRDSDPALPPRPTDSQFDGMLGANSPRTHPGWQPPTPEELQSRLPQYEVHELLGRGGMGAVYKGWQRSLERLVAIKILPPGLVSGEIDFAARFKREAKAMARLKHPGIIPVHDAGETADGLLYFVMDFVAGTDLQKMLAARGRLPPEEALPIITRVLDALSYAHRHGIIHRDIKPANIMVDEEGNVLVADFGLARSTASDTTMLTLSNVAMGTPDFMAPESHLGMDQVDHRADLYAVGVMLYQMLTGKLPRGRFEPPSRAVPGLDKRLDRIVDRTLMQERDARYSSAIELKSALDPVVTRIAAKRKIATVENSRRSGKRPVILLGVAAVVKTFLAATFVLLHRLSSSREPGAPELKLAGVSSSPSLPVSASSPSWQPALGKPLEQLATTDGARSFRDGWLTLRGGMPRVETGFGQGAARVRVAWLAQTQTVKLGLSGTDLELHIGTNGEATLLRFDGKGYESDPPRLSLPAALTPGSEATLQLAWIGGRVQGWVNGQSIGSQPLRAGRDHVTGIHFSNDKNEQQVRLRDFEVLNLDGLPEAEALKLAGVETSSKSQSVSVASDHTWHNALAEPPLQGVLAGADHNAQGYLFADNNWVFSSPAMRSGAVRARVTSELGSLGLAMFLDGGRRYYRTSLNPETKRGALKFLQDGLAETTLVTKHDLNFASGKTFECVTARVDGHLWVLLDGKLVMDAPEPNPAAGKWGLQSDPRQRVRVKNIEYVNLDGLSEAEALRLAGVSSAPTTPRWHDALAELPLKDVIAKADHNAQGWLLPSGNHWPITQPLHAGAIRIRVMQESEGHPIFLDAVMNEGVRYVQSWLCSRISAKARTEYVNHPYPDQLLAQNEDAEMPLGRSCELTLARVAGKFWTLLDGKTVLQAADPDSSPERLTLDCLRDSTVRVEKVEYINLDDLPEAEALELAGVSASFATDVLSFGSHRYQFVPGAITWAAAKAKAEQMGGHLATLTSKEECEAVYGLCRKAMPKQTPVPGQSVPPHQAWLGAARAGDAAWQWVTGESFTYTDWNPLHTEDRHAAYGLTVMTVQQLGDDLRAWNGVLTTDREVPHIAGFIVEWEDTGAPHSAK